MKSRPTSVSAVLVLALAPAATMAGAVARPPVLDVHLHALAADAQGPPPLGMCTPMPGFSAWDPRRPYPEAFAELFEHPSCGDPVWSPTTDEALRDRTIAVMERLNVYGVLSGSADRVREWREAAPGRFIAGLGFQLTPEAPSPGELRERVRTGTLEVLAEVTNQYLGIGPDDDRMAPYWAMAEEMALPVGIHMGPGPPGAAYLGSTGYRARLGSLLLLEDVLVRHPGLRIYAMHAGFPLLDDALAALYAHPQLHVGVGVLVFTQPRAVFYRYLKALVDAGFEERILFGSDQMVWPEAIERGIRRIEEAPFLSESQKRAILYDNAARFLRLSGEERDRHRGR
jgi:hypothetical protein